MIPIEKEPPELLAEFHVYERCHFCKASTPWWHKRTNNPVCPVCAKTHKVAELPDFGRELRAASRKRSC